MDFRQRFGEENIHKAVAENGLFLKEELTKMGIKLLSRMEDRSGIVTLYCKSGPEACEKLFEKGIVVRDTEEIIF